MQFSGITSAFGICLQFGGSVCANVKKMFVVTIILFILKVEIFNVIIAFIHRSFMLNLCKYYIMRH